jgi:hypothetical protein
VLSPDIPAAVFSCTCICSRLFCPFSFSHYIVFQKEWYMLVCTSCHLKNLCFPIAIGACNMWQSVQPACRQAGLWQKIRVHPCCFPILPGQAVTNPFVLIRVIRGKRIRFHSWHSCQSNLCSSVPSVANPFVLIRVIRGRRICFHSCHSCQSNLCSSVPSVANPFVLIRVIRGKPFPGSPIY